jgi:hypothetical protein
MRISRKSGLIFSSVSIIDETGRKVGMNLVAYDHFLKAGDAFRSLLAGN